MMFNFPFNQISEKQKQVLRDLLKEVNAKKILEIGSWVGESTSVLAQHAKENDGYVVSIDWWKGNPGTDLNDLAIRNDVFAKFRHNLEELELFDYVIPVVSTSSKAAKVVAGDFDLIFIDADHRYSYVKQDIENYLPKVRDGGILCGHDCESNVWDESFIEEDYRGNKHHGCIKAVHEAFPNVLIKEEIWIKKK